MSDAEEEWRRWAWENGSCYVPTLGSESTSAEDPVKEVAKAAAGSSLCSECFHVEVCAILTVARTIMPDGGFDVSSCAMFFPTPKEEPHE